ncbi:MAG: hypothetical protein D6753_00620 [Planctomycetota bacterium]|nr:MAG: hypothetical protein D6753_00620 [Planctomycetota bacterium]
MCRDKLSGWLLGLALTIAGVSPCAGQTYWATAPASPGSLKARQPNEGRRIQSLPPPPSSMAGSESQGSRTVPSPDVEATREARTVPNGPQSPPQPPAAGTASVSQSASSPILLPPPPRLDQLRSMRGPLAGNAATEKNVPAQTVSSVRPSGSLPHLQTPVSRASKEPTEFDAARLIAVVGTEHVLAGDLAGFVEPIVEANRDRLPDKRAEDQVRQQLTRQVLKQYIVIKAMYQEFFRDMAGNAAPEEIQAMKKQVSTRASKIFHERQVPVLMKQNEVTNLRDLELKLREKSMSLATMKRQFIEQAIAQELERKYVPSEFEVSLDELWDYYQTHTDEWFVPAQARWRQLTIRFDRHASREEVEQRIKELGNQVYLGGLPFEAAARQYSEGYTAEQGGVYDWTRKGSLKSQPLDRAIFSIPLGRLSQVIEDDIGMHIIEVLERVPEHHTPFEEAQAEIRQKLSEEKRSEALQKFHRKVLARTPVWSLWPEDIREICPHVRPLEDAVGR